MKIFFDDVLQFPRMLVALVQRRYFKMRAAASRLSKVRRAYAQQAALADRRIRDYFSKITTDVGRVVKGGVSVARKAWDIVASILNNAVEIVLILVPKRRTGKLRSRLATQFFAPGAVSRAMDAVVGQVRAGDSAKNVAAATRDLLLRERLKKQVFSLAKTVKDTGQQQAIVIEMAAASERPRSRANSTTVMHEALREKGHDWCMPPQALGVCYKTFPQSVDAAEIRKALREAWHAPSRQPTKTTASRAPLLPGQVRAIELTYAASRALVVEKLADSKTELVSNIVVSNGVNVAAFYMQLKSGLEELRQQDLCFTEASQHIITLDSAMPAEVQAAYLLCCIKLGCVCNDENGEIYNPDAPEKDLLQLGGKALSVAVLKKENADFLQADEENPLANTTKRQGANDRRYLQSGKAPVAAAPPPSDKNPRTRSF